MDSVSHQSLLLAVESPTSLDSNSSIASPKEPPLFLGRQLVACDNTKKHQHILDAFKAAQEKYHPALSSKQQSSLSSMTVATSSVAAKTTALAHGLRACLTNDPKKITAISLLESEIKKAATQAAAIKPIAQTKNKPIADLCSKLEAICNRRANLALAKLSSMEAKLDPSNKKNIAAKASAIITAEKHYRTAINELNRSGFQLKHNKPAGRSADTDSQISQETKEKAPAGNRPRSQRGSLEADTSIWSDSTEEFRGKLASFKNFLRGARETQGLVDAESSGDNSNSRSSADSFDEPDSDVLFSDSASFDTDEQDSNPSEITTEESLSRQGSPDNLTVLLPSVSDGEIKSLKKEPSSDLLTAVTDAAAHHEHLQSLHAELLGTNDAEVENALSDVPKKVDYHSLMDTVIDELAIVAARQDAPPLEEAGSHALSILGHSQPRNTIDAAKLKEWIEPSFTDSSIHLGKLDEKSADDATLVRATMDDMLDKLDADHAHEPIEKPFSRTISEEILSDSDQDDDDSISDDDMPLTELDSLPDKKNERTSTWRNVSAREAAEQVATEKRAAEAEIPPEKLESKNGDGNRSLSGRLS